jgi:N-acetylglucosaminyldiphosphoundecaprenol N-acetyl-beta-D-mannosaminyltransferase
VHFLGVRFDRMTPDRAAEMLLDGALARESRRVCFANAHTMNLWFKDARLRKALAACDLLLADGSGVLWGSKLVGKALTHNLNGTDLVPELCRRGASKGLSVYLLGAKPGVAEDVAKNLTASYPGLTIAGLRNGYVTEAELPQVLADIRAAQPHVLLVAMGVPNQEVWIDRHADELPGVTCIGVGGLFDFLALRVPRAPKLFRITGMEWSWRMMMEPRRLWKRYLIGNLVYFAHLLRHGWSNRPAFPLPPTEPAEPASPTTRPAAPPPATSSEFKHSSSSPVTATRRRSA